MQRAMVTLCRFVALRNPMHRHAAATLSIDHGLMPLQSGGGSRNFCC
jgi:hypothetical protein